MKKLINKLFFIFILFLFPVMGCEKSLEVTPPGELAPENALSIKKGLTALLYSAYSQYAYLPVINQWNNVVNMNETCTDIAFNTGGAENRFLALFINFQWDPSTGWLDNFLWRRPFLAIRNANLVIENVDNVEDMTADEKAQYKAEARYIRGAKYSMLYNWFGPVPIFENSLQDAHQPRPTDEEMKTFIEKELIDAIPHLPAPGEEEEYGRANKGHALAFLTKFYLNTKQWQKAIDASGDLMDLGYYELFGSFRNMFKVENEGWDRNKEMIVVWPRKAETEFGNTYANGAFPPGFRTCPTIPEFTWTTSMNNWGTQYRLRDEFVDSFDPADERLGLIVQEYINDKGVLVNLRATPNNSRSLKYFDNNATLNFHGNDYAVIRYSDILLSRAEAINEVNGPTQEAVDLLNAVRARAKVNIYQLSDVGDKDNFRDLILAERSWEFVSEGKRREDLIRHGKFISSALGRGITNAKPHHVLFPIPQFEVEANNAIGPEDQNEGY